mmetsp:Transcript_24161/g.24088  ORF Transcript_24161/g.24088 Transcript_24161/m.24088 type:complete len:109 (+) Transcript_24161:1-327(+)
MEYSAIGIEPSAKSVWLSRPEKMLKGNIGVDKKTIRNIKTNAFNPDTRKIISPIVENSPVKAKRSTEGDLNKSYQHFFKKPNNDSSFRGLRSSGMNSGRKSIGNSNQF